MIMTLYSHKTGTSLFVVVVLQLFQISTAEHNFTDCYAANHPNEYNYCNVSYTEWLRLICPNSTGSWGRQTAEGATVPLCFEAVCEVKHNLHYEDSGTYFCRTQENTKYYVNISVLAPPELLGVQLCTADQNICYYGALHPKVTDPQFNVTVKYAGYGEFNVTWSRNGKPVNCLPHCSQGKSNNEAWIAIFNNVSFDKEVNITYSANVSSEYGWNASATQVRFECSSIPKPVGPPDKNSVQLIAGEGASISCKVPMQMNTKLGICFAPVGENLTSLNRSKSCVECNPYYIGLCKGSIATKPGWQVARSTSNTAACMTYQITNLTIPKVQESDRGTVYCYWSTSSEVGGVYQMDTITVLSDSWIDQNWEYLVVGGVGVPLVLVVLLCVVSIASCYITARRRRIKRLMDVADYPTENGRGDTKRHADSNHNTASMKRNPNPRRGKARKMFTNWSRYPSDGATNDTSDSEYFCPRRYSPRNASCEAVTINADVHDDTRTPLLQAPRSTCDNNVESGSSLPSSYGSTDEHVETEAPLLTHTDPEWDLPPQKEAKLTSFTNV